MRPSPRPGDGRAGADRRRAPPASAGRRCGGPTRPECEVALERGDRRALTSGADREPGRRGGHRGIERPLRVRPERRQRPVRRLAGDRHRLDVEPAGPQPASELLEGREVAAILLRDLGQVVADHPQLLRDLGVEGDDQDRARGDATQLTDARLRIPPPVVDRQDGQGRVDARVTQGQVRSVGTQGRSEVRRALGGHVAGLDRHHVTTGGFVGPGPGADVDDRLRVAELTVDERTQAWIWSPGGGIAVSDPVVPRHRHGPILEHSLYYCQRSAERPAQRALEIRAQPLGRIDAGDQMAPDGA